jgi:hypothetical protein
MAIPDSIDADEEAAASFDDVACKRPEVIPAELRVTAQLLLNIRE